MYKIYITILILLAGVLSGFAAQNIHMKFPHFGGKNYEFIIFQGTAAEKVQEGTIPADGQFTLSIPKQYAPYTGMCRWLITGTQEGGGLDMIIPGKDFSVSCLSSQPDNTNIIYRGNEENVKLNDFHKTQEQIYARHDAMFQATKAYSPKDKNYTIFMKEYKNQVQAYDHFQAKLEKESSYAVNFLQIVNTTLGIGPKIENSEEKRALDISRCITDKMNWQHLYTSGHWSGVISSWADIHGRIFKDKNRFAFDFAIISKKLNNAKQYKDFVGRVTYVLTEQGNDDFITAISAQVLASGKIESYDGVLAVYTKGMVGSFAPDLTVSGTNGNEEKIVLKSSGLLDKDYKKTLLAFYNSECGSCEGLLNDLSKNSSRIKEAGIRIISLSSDTDKSKFEEKSRTFSWKDVYCDFKGIKGENFRNFGIVGTPTLFFIDIDGKIIARSANLRDLNSYLKNINSQ